MGARARARLEVYLEVLCRVVRRQAIRNYKMNMSKLS